jgi:hypothetical protein
MNLREIMAMNLRRKRHDLEMTQEELAERAGLSARYVGAIRAWRCVRKRDCARANCGSIGNRTGRSPQADRTIGQIVGRSRQGEGFALGPGL